MKQSIPRTSPPSFENKIASARSTNGSWLFVLLIVVAILASAALAHGQTRGPVSRRLTTVEENVDGLANLAGDLLNGFEQLHRETESLRTEVVTLRGRAQKNVDPERIARLEHRLGQVERALTHAETTTALTTLRTAVVEPKPDVVVSGNWTAGDKRFEFSESGPSIYVELNGPGIVWAAGELRRSIGSSESQELIANGSLRGVFTNDPSGSVRIASASIREVTENVVTMNTYRIEWDKFGRETSRTPVTVYLNRR